MSKKQSKPHRPRRPLKSTPERKTARERPVADYEVGYGRPPEDGKFKPGHAPHPGGGRPKGSKNLATKVRAVMSRKITITEKGKQRTITADEAILHRYLERALNGDVKTGAFLLALQERLQPQEIGDVGGNDLSSQDEQIMRNFMERLGTKPPNGGNEDPE